MYREIALSIRNKFREAGVMPSLLALAFIVAVCFATPVMAQQLSVDLGEGGSITGRVVQLILIMTVLSLAPSILIMMTSFTRLVIVFSMLRSALGTQSTPPNIVLVSLAMFLTFYIMQPTFTKIWDTALNPLMEEQIDESAALDLAIIPMKDFMLTHVREKDLALFISMSGKAEPEEIRDISMITLIPAFMISELRRAFEIGFLIYIPFIVIDMVVASVLMALGMMLPPVMIALPFKVIFFVLVDGFNLLVGSLVQSFGALPPPGTG